MNKTLQVKTKQHEILDRKMNEIRQRTGGKEEFSYHCKCILFYYPRLYKYSELKLSEYVITTCVWIVYREKYFKKNKKTINLVH